MSQKRNIAANISADIGAKTHIELQVLALRQGRTIREVAGVLLDSLFEEIEEIPSVKFADVQLLQQQVKSLESQMEKLSAQLEVISKLPALNPPEPSTEVLTEESDVHGDRSGEVVTEAEPDVQEALEEVHENSGTW